MPSHESFHVGQRVYVVDDGLDPVVQKGIVKRNLDQYPNNVKVQLDSEGPPIGCHPDQVLPENADGEMVDEFLSIRTRE
jgi:hypothetical protein